MRETARTIGEPFDKERLADFARRELDNSIEQCSGYAVAAAVQMEISSKDGDEEYTVYTAPNVTYSGMEFKLHAEQLATWMGLLDAQLLGDSIDVNIKDVMVITSGDDIALKCGHCLQTIIGACRVLGHSPSGVRYMAYNSEDGIDRFIVRSIEDLIGDTYVSRRE